MSEFTMDCPNCNEALRLIWINKKAAVYTEFQTQIGLSEIPFFYFTVKVASCYLFSGHFAVVSEKKSF